MASTAGARVLQRQHRLKERRMSRGALGPELLDELVKRHILVAVGAQGHVPDSCDELAECRFPAQIGTSRTSVFTKNPMSGSTSTRVRPAIGDPTAMSVWPV